MRSLALAMLLVPCVHAALAADCVSQQSCDQCAKDSEFSWNPENPFVTPRLQRFYELIHLVKAADEGKDSEGLARLAKEYLDLAAVYRCNWNYGNAIHDANSHLGRSVLREGNIDEAARYLALAGKSTGSPQLDTFGPDLDLADQLLKRGKVVPVQEYLRDIKRFWKMDHGQVDRWLVAIDKGERPELNRFAAMQPSVWTIALWSLIFILPAVVALILFFVGLDKLTRKVAFLIVGIVAGYAAQVLTAVGIYFLLPVLVGGRDVGALIAFTSGYFVPVLLMAIPALVVFLAYRLFLPRAGRIETQ